MTDRETLIEELTRLVPSRKARDVYLRRDDAALERTVARLREIERHSRSVGHVAATGADLRPVETAPARRAVRA